MLNKVTLIGNLGRDPEVRTMQNGNKVCNISLATTEKWKDKSSGERMERTEWHRVVIFDERLVDVAEKYLSKGSKVYLGGQIQTRKWTDQSGTEKYSTEIVLQRFGGRLIMLDSKTDGGSSKGRTSDFESDNAGSNPAPPASDLDDEIPY